MQDIENEIFQGWSCEPKRLESFGFAKEGADYILRQKVGDGDFEATIKIDSKGDVDGNIVEIDTQEPFPNFRYKRQTGGFATKLAAEYKELLLGIREQCFLDKRTPDYWMLPSNPAMYDVDEGFRRGGGTLEWPAKRRLKIGDVVYIYCAKPVSGIKWRCVVTYADDVARDFYWGKNLYVTNIKLEKTYNGDEFPLQTLLDNGLSTVRWLVKMGPEIKAYLIEHDPRTE
ncbi:MAG: hypothetical protein K6F32_04840 [Bacilli bacterium]|nr:hypothetical protein [Bacilli bacterium]